MHFHAVVDRVPIVPALDPLWAVIFLAIFVAAALTVRARPGLGAAMLLFIAPFAAPHAIAATTVTLEKVTLIGVLAGLGMRYDGRTIAGFPRAIIVMFAAIVVIDAGTFGLALHHAQVIRETLKWLEYALVFLAVFVCYALDPQPHAARLAWGASLTLVAVSALAEIFTGAGSGMFVQGHAVPRIAGVLEGPNQLGGYLVVAIAAFAAWQVREPHRAMAWLLAASGAVLALSFSRSALLCTLAALATIAWIERARIARVWTLIAGALAGYAVIFFASPDASVAALAVRTSDTYAGVSGGVGTRSELWRAAIALFRIHPFFGVGAGNFEYDLPQVGLSGVRTQANNWYLQALAEGGIALLAATAGWIVAVFRTVRAQVERSPWALGALAATVAMTLHGFTDDLMFYPKVAEVWIALIALGCART